MDKKTKNELERQQVTPMDLMLMVKKDMSQLYYHKDLNTFNWEPLTPKELDQVFAKPTPEKLPHINEPGGNSFTFLTFEEIDHKEVMRFYVREFIYEKADRKKLFDILRRYDFVDAFTAELKNLVLYEDFRETVSDIYDDKFNYWAEERGLTFK